MKKRILCLVMAAVMTAGTAVPAFAEQIQSSKNWLVDFDGSRMNSNFSSSEASSEVYGLLPGDSIELQVGVKNSGEKDTDWYLKNTILQTLEDGSNAAGGAYTYNLSFVDPDHETTVLYSSETVGGEGSGPAGEGLHQATDSLEDAYVYLGRLSQGETGSVHLTVALDGETQGNSYQDTLAKLQMDFAVENVTSNVEYKTGETTTITRRERNVIRTSPKTGDTTNILAFCAVALVSGLALLAAGIRLIRKNRGERKGE